MKLIDKLAWIHLKNRSILSTKSYGKDTYYIPGGKREQGESDLQALCREIREELSVELLPASLQWLGTFEAQAHGHPEGTIVRMTCYLADYTGELAPAAEIEEMAWLQYADKHKISAVDKLIFDHLKEKQLIS